MEASSAPQKSKALTNEAKVGLLVAATGLVALGFAWVIGIQNPFSSTVRFHVTYNFAGGIEVGSPVRVSGIKVGKVEKIEFFVPVEKGQVALSEPGSDTPSGDQAIAPLRVTISVSKDAARGVRQDSRFYVNMAGIIGERYVEITPGHFSTPEIHAGDTVAGVDPPRIDQLISQSFDLAGKITDLVRENKGDITRSIELLYKLSGNLNKTLDWVDKSKIFKTDLSKLVDNLIAITSDVRAATDKAKTPEGKRTLALLYDLLWRLEPLDKDRIHKFLQEEGIRARIF